MNKSEIYERITDTIINSLEQGLIPWRCPWLSEMPKNLVSKKEYRGINTLILACSPFPSPYWLTYKQSQELGGHVKKGEKSTTIIFWKFLDGTDEKGQPKRIPLARAYHVFNLAQCEDIEEGKIPKTKKEKNGEDFDPIEGCEKIVNKMPNAPSISIGSLATYDLKSDMVEMPPSSSFDSPSLYYSTLFHELTHSTGHTSRLNRASIMEKPGYLSSWYCKEELIAEFGAAFLSGKCGIEQETIKNSPSYIFGWLSRLKKDNRLLIQAAGAAQRATDFILGKKE